MESAHIDTFAQDNLPGPKLWPKLNLNVPGLDYPSQLNCAAELLDRAIERGWQDRALFRSGTLETYGQFNARANQIANVLVRKYGLIAGQRVLLRGANTPTLAALWFAVLKAGGICVTTMPLLRA